MYYFTGIQVTEVLYIWLTKACLQDLYINAVGHLACLFHWILSY